MQSVVSLREAYSLAVRSLVGAGLLVAVSLGCSVDDSGLAGTSEKLQRDGGGAGGLAATGSGGSVATGGVNGGGGSVGTGGGVTGGGGTIAGGTGGAPGTGGTSATGSGGAPGSGGALGAGGAMATGGVSGTGGTPATGGTPGSGGAPGTGGATSTGGMTGTGGTPATGGAPGTGGTPGTGGGMGMGGAGGTKCGSGNCDGCCSADGQCVKTTSAKQCGSMGAACVACAPCEICSNQMSSGMGPPNPGGGACAIDPTSQWTIVAVSGQVTMSPPGGGTWDPPHGDEGGSAPDLFCEYENPANDVSATTAGVTDTVVDVFTATWDQTITPPGVTVSASALMAEKPAWRIWVGDEDCVSPNNCGTLGQIACSYTQPITAASLESGEVTISNYQSCVSLTLQLVCQAPATTP